MGHISLLIQIYHVPLLLAYLVNPFAFGSRKRKFADFQILIGSLSGVATC